MHLSNYSNTKKVYFVLYSHAIFIILLFLLGNIFLFQSTLNSWKEINFITSIIGLILFVWCLYSWIYLAKEVFNPYIFLICSFYIFMNGQAFLNIFGLNDKYFTFDTKEMFMVQLFTSVCFGFFHLGALSNFFKVKNPIEQSAAVISENHYAALKIIGILLTCISIIPTIWIQLEYLKVFLTYGYGYEGTHNSDLIQISGTMIRLQGYFLPGILSLIVGFKNNTAYRNIALIIVVLYAVSTLIIGDRSLGIALILAVYWLWNTGVKKVKIKLRTFIILGAFLVLLMFSIGTLRHLDNFTLSSIVSSLSNLVSESNPIVHQINEMGWSARPLILTMQLIPDSYQYSLGTSYVDSIASILPSSIRNILGIDVELSLSTWLMESLNMKTGPGYSIVAEAYYNFGWYGSLFMVFIGAFFGKVLGYNATTEKRNNPITIVIIAVVLCLSITVMRRNMGAVVSPLFYNALIPYILLNICSKEIKRKNGNKKF